MSSEGRCPTHPSARIVGKCVICGKPVCAECFAARGYLCSEACHAEAQRRAPSEAATRGVPDEEAERLGRRTDLVAFWLFRGVPVLIVLLVLLGLGLRFLDWSGRERWVLRAPEKVWFAKTVADGDTLHVLRSDGLYEALAVTDGHSRWQVRLDGNPERESGAEEGMSLFSSLWGGDLIVTNGLVICDARTELRVMDAADGRGLWLCPVDPYSRRRFACDGRRLLFVDELVPGGRAPDPTGRSEADALALLLRRRTETVPHLICRDARSGKALWTRRYEGRNVKGLAIGETVCFAISRVSPKMRWQPCARHVGAAPRVMAQCAHCSYTWDSDAAYEMNVIRAADGAPLWSSKLGPDSIEQACLYEDRIVLLSSGNMYVLGLDGVRHGRYALPGTLWRATAGPDRVIVGLEQGGLLALSSRDARVLWETRIEGRAWDLQVAADALYVTAGIPRERDKTADGTAAEPRPLTPAEKMMQEMMGGHEQETAKVLSLRPSDRTLVCYDAKRGKERWRKRGFVGSLTALPGGYLRLVQGGEAAPMFLKGTGAVLSEHLCRNGKVCWQYKVRESITSVVPGPETLLLVCRPGTGMFGGAWSEDAADTASIRAIRRRTWLNRARKW